MISGNLSAHKYTTIMMVDDDPIMMNFIKVVLEKAGNRKIICEDDSRRAISVIENAIPDILLLDVVMPQAAIAAQRIIESINGSLLYSTPHLFASSS